MRGASPCVARPQRASGRPSGKLRNINAGTARQVLRRGFAPDLRTSKSGRDPGLSRAWEGTKATAFNSHIVFR